MLAATIREGEEKLAARRQAAALARTQLARALLALQRAQGRQVGERLDWAITQQRDVEEAALRLTKGVNSLYQRAAKWKAEQRRFRVHLEASLSPPELLGSFAELLNSSAGLLSCCGDCRVDALTRLADDALLVTAGAGELRRLGRRRRGGPARHRRQPRVRVRGAGQGARGGRAAIQRPAAVIPSHARSPSISRGAHKLSIQQQYVGSFPPRLMMARKAKGERRPPRVERPAPPGSRSWLLPLVVAAAVVVLAVLAPQLLPRGQDADLYISRHLQLERKRFDVQCHLKKLSKRAVPGCHHVGNNCGRAVKDAFVTPEEVDQLREIAEIGMANRSRLGGPTIMDVNTGYVKDGDGLVNIYQKTPASPPEPRFTREQFALYRRVIESIRQALIEEFQLEVLYFTAPTFITRIVGNESWSPAEIHDEYWHPHVDKDNTQHYDYSGLLYLADYEDDFTGGLFAFIDKESEQVVEPARGRLMMFTSGKENLHQVKRVESGTRYVMSMWFSCDSRKQFHNFLDGKMHQHFIREDI